MRGFRSVVAGLSVAVLAGGLVPGSPAGAGSGQLSGGAAAAQAAIVRASYAGTIMTPGKRVDVPRTIERLKAARVSTYAFLVRGPVWWKDLQVFLPEAQKAGINVWPYLLPPSECPGGPKTCSSYLPHKKNYVAWGQAIAKLSLRYPNLTGWAIDDFANNAGSTYTPAYVKKMRAATAKINKNLRFYPVVYTRFLRKDPKFVSKYGPLMDGMIWPYMDEYNRNTVWTRTLRTELNWVVGQLAKKGRKAIVMPYASRLSYTAVPPDVDYVRQVTAVGMEYARRGKVLGVMQYKLPLVPDRRQDSDPNRSRPPGHGRLTFSVNPSRKGGTWPTAKDAVASANAPVKLNKGSRSCTLVAWHSDTRSTKAPRGYHYKQIRVNKKVIWERDVAGDSTRGRNTSRLDLTRRLTNGQARLQFRLHDKKKTKNYPVDVSFDDIQLRGCTVPNPSLEKPGGWTFTRNHGRMTPGQHITDPRYSSSVLNAVRALYG